MNSNSFIRVQKKYFFKFEFGKIIEFKFEFAALKGTEIKMKVQISART